MRKGQLTREAIIGKAARLFNSKGFFGSSLADVMEATGLEKGGIYNHFESKEQLALEAFDYAFRLHGEFMREKVDAEDGAVNKLLAVINCFKKVVDDPLLPGGCPLLNGAIESDDAYPPLKDRVRKAMNRLLRFVKTIVVDGIEDGEIRAGCDPAMVASFIVATVEGGVMLSRLYDDKQHMKHVVEQTSQFIRELAAP